MKPTHASQGTLDGITTRLLARRQDPVTSKQAAKAVAVRLTARQEQALATLVAYGPGTTHELASRATELDPTGLYRIDRATAIHHELARRLPELARKGKAEVVLGEVRQGCRVWRAR